MEFFNRHVTKRGFNVIIKPTQSPRPPASSSEPTAVPIQFVLKSVDSYYRKPFRRHRILHQQLVTITESSDYIDRHTFLSSPEHCHNLISQNLSDLGIGRHYHDQIAEEFIDSGRRVSPTGDYVIIVEVKVVKEHMHEETQSETDSVDGEDDNGMVAASESSIKGLKRKRIGGEDEECKRNRSTTSCVVCLEDLVMGEQATCMPCSHLFHGECITRWLKTSHSCPVCRFKLPTA